MAADPDPTPRAPVDPHPTARAPSPAFARHLRDCLGMFATGVTIVTTGTADGGFAGLTVNSFNSVSLDPPLVLWSLGRRATSVGDFLAARTFAVNVLAAEQLELALRFSRSGGNRFEGLSLHEGLGGAPLIAGAIAWFECETRTHQIHGDHVLFIGEVKRCARASGRPLVFEGGGFAVAHPLPAEPIE